MDATVPALLNLPTPNSTTERIKDIDPGRLPPRARYELMQAAASADGWRPKESADQIGVRPGFVSELSHDLRLAVAFANGVFPDLSSEEYEDLLCSIAESGVRVPVILDERGEIIDGHARVRAYEELRWIAEAVDLADGWRQIVSDGTAAPIRIKEAKDNLARLGSYADDFVALACERNWQDLPVERREALTAEERRQLIVSLNAGPRGRTLKRGDIRILIEVELMIDRQLEQNRSLREIARLVGCDHKYVLRLKQAMAEEEQALANAQPELEVGTSPQPDPWKPVGAYVICANCDHTLALERSGRQYRAVETNESAEAA